jgi:uncharacterized protein (TIGR02599 family)
MVILAMMMLIITTVISQAQRSWKAASSKVSQFREARRAFDTVTRNLRQAAIDTHREFIYPDKSSRSDPMIPPSGFGRTATLGIKFGQASQLVEGGSATDLPGHAVVFQAPLGKTAMGEGSSTDISQLKSLLCVRGYYVQFGSDESLLPLGLKDRLQPRSRYRLYEYQPNTENNTVYGSDSQAWAKISMSNARAEIRPVADNILMLGLAIAFAPAAGTGTATARLAGDTAAQLEYDYDSYSTSVPSRLHRLPRYVQVFMIAMDEESAARLALQNGSSAPDPLRSSGATFTKASNLFQDPGGDLAKVRAYMDKQRLNYRIFNASVIIMGAES